MCIRDRYNRDYKYSYANIMKILSGVRGLSVHQRMKIYEKMNEGLWQKKEYCYEKDREISLFSNILDYKKISALEFFGIGLDRCEICSDSTDLQSNLHDFNTCDACKISMAGYVNRYKDYSIEGFMAWAITNPNIKSRIKENKSKLNKETDK